MKLFKLQRWLNLAIAPLFLTLLLFCISQLPSRTQATSVHSAQPTANTNNELAQNSPNQNHNHSYHDADITFTLRTSVGNGKLLVFSLGLVVQTIFHPFILLGKCLIAFISKHLLLLRP